MWRKIWKTDCKTEGSRCDFNLCCVMKPKETILLVIEWLWKEHSISLGYTSIKYYGYRRDEVYWLLLILPLKGAQILSGLSIMKKNGLSGFMTAALLKDLIWEEGGKGTWCMLTLRTEIREIKENKQPVKKGVTCKHPSPSWTTAQQQLKLILPQKSITLRKRKC